MVEDEQLDAPTLQRRATIVVNREQLRARLREIGDERYYDPMLSDLSQMAAYTEQAIAKRRGPRAVRQGLRLIRLWNRRKRYLTQQTSNVSYGSVEPKAARIAGGVLRRPARRESHARRPGHRRVRTATRAGPDDGPGEPNPGPSRRGPR